MTEGQKIGLWVNLNRCQAQQRIQSGQFDETDYEGIYELFMQAYGDEAMARRAQAQAAERLVMQRTEEARAR